MNTSRAQIIATIGPASESIETLTAMLDAGMDIARLNFAWDACDGHEDHIQMLRSLSRPVPIIQDLPGPRIQHEHGHEHNTALPGFTDGDAELIACAATHRLEWVAVSFVRDASDIERCRVSIAGHGATSRIIAKIERPEALEHLDEIIAAADAVMVARGDLGQNIPIEQVPFVQADIITRCNAAHKPVIVATQMLMSMTENSEPTRAEVADIAEAIVQGADAVMLSEESAVGKHPALAVATMEKVVLESERHRDSTKPINPLS